MLIGNILCDFVAYLCFFEVQEQIDETMKQMSKNAKRRKKQREEKARLRMKAELRERKIKERNAVRDRIWSMYRKYVLPNDEGVRLKFGRFITYEEDKDYTDKEVEESLRYMQVSGFIYRDPLSNVPRWMYSPTSAIKQCILKYLVNTYDGATVCDIHREVNDIFGCNLLKKTVRRFISDDMKYDEMLYCRDYTRKRTLDSEEAIWKPRFQTTYVETLILLFMKEHGGMTSPITIKQIWMYIYANDEFNRSINLDLIISDLILRDFIYYSDRSKHSLQLYNR